MLGSPVCQRSRLARLMPGVSLPLPLLVAILTTAVLTPWAAAQPQANDLGLASRGGNADDGGTLVAFYVDEALQAADLNGDGDMSDYVHHTYDAATGTTSNLGLAAAVSLGGPLSPLVSGNLVPLLVGEPQQGATDLNGDGDTFDKVLFLYDHAMGTTTNLGFAVRSQVPAANGRVIFCALESTLGDLNGDSDTLDAVFHAYDVASGTVTNLGIAGDSTPEKGCFINVQGDIVALGAREDAEGQDLNGDGDTLDIVAHVHDFSTGVTTSLGLAAPGVVEGSFVLLQVRETSQGQDLNGDGDISSVDRVLHVHDVAAGTTTNVGYDASFTVDGTAAALGVSESAQGYTDLNGDGDTADRVLHVYDLAAGGAPTNLGLAFAGTPLIGGSVVSLAVSEASQNGTDLNGDGDTSDIVVHLYDLTTSTTTNLGFATLGLPWIRGNFVVFDTPESNGDLNGDGDTLDRVPHVHDLTTGTTLSTGLAGSRFTRPLLGSVVLFSVSETSHGGADLNGDGDTLDEVVHAFDAATSTTTNFGVARSIYGGISWGSAATFSADEARQGGVDLNGDGDTTDVILQVISLGGGDMDADGLSDGFETGFGGTTPQTSIGVTNPETGDAATATGSAQSGATITSGSFSVQFPPNTTVDSAAAQIVITLVPGSPTKMAVSGADLGGATKSVTMPFDASATTPVVCIDDDPSASIGTVLVNGVCAGVTIAIPASDGQSTMMGAFTVTRVSTVPPRVRVDGLSNTALATFSDTDLDGIADDAEASFGTDPNDPDSDDDGLLDGVEVSFTPVGCLDPLDADSDDDGLSDGAEVNAMPSTSPCNPDSDGDGLADAIDANPLDPQMSTGALEDGTRTLSSLVDGFPETVFQANNANAQRGRRNSLSTLIRNAANTLALGDAQAAIALLTAALKRVDGQGRDWMLPSAERDALESSLVALIQVLGP